MSEQELSRLARRGSGSASRSIPGGFVEWQAGTGDEDSFGFSIASPEHWNLAACLATPRDAHHNEETNGFHFTRKRISPAFGT